MAKVMIKRTFRLNASDLPDPDPSKTPEDVLHHYVDQYPFLKNGKVEDHGIQGDAHVFVLKKNEYKSNG